LIGQVTVTRTVLCSVQSNLLLIMLSVFSSGQAPVVQSHQRGTEFVNCVNGKEFLAELSDCQLQGKMELCQCTQFTEFIAPTKCTVSCIGKCEYKCINIDI
jgi:hypothetical protein